MNNDTSFVHYGAFLGRTYSYVKVLVVLTGTKVLVCARVLVCSCVLDWTTKKEWQGEVKPPQVYICDASSATNHY